MTRWTLALAAALLLSTACGSDPANPPTDAVADGADLLPDDPGGQPDAPPPADTPADVAAEQAPADVPPEEGEDAPGEIVKDETPPTVASSIPANEAMDVAIPFVVKVTFSEAIRYEQTVDESTFQVTDISGTQLDGTLSYDAATFTVTFTPAPTVVLYRASPYKVLLSALIQDKAGNRMAQTEIAFSTTAGNLAPYEALAAKYAPFLYQAVNKAAPQFDYPTSFDFDKDWKAANNDMSIMKGTSVPAWIYWDVAETKSHYFIRYGYFYPRHSDTDTTFGNEVAGAIVVVAKRPTETPIAVETYFGAASKEDIRSFVTTESGLVKDGAAGESGEPDGNLNDKDRKYFGVNWVLPQATLFPLGRYQAYLTSGTHESCAWAQTNKETPLDFRCVLNDGIKSQLFVVRYAYVDGVATDIKKGASGFPIATADGQDIGYGLKSVVKEWWVRRDRLADLYGSQFTYEPPEGRPGANLQAPTSFQNTTSPELPGGRPPWAWSWKPTVADPDFYYKQFGMGTPFLDPAYYFAQRHRLTLTTGKDGFSSTYCFNPYLLIDQRGKDPECTTAQ